MRPLPSSIPALITGASSGIGAEFARQLAARGHNLTLVARRQDRLETLAEQLREQHKIEVQVIVADLIKVEDRKKIAEILRNSSPWLLINNAGFGTHGNFSKLDAQREIEQVTLNCVAVTELTAAVLPGNLEKRAGGIINLASTAAFQPLPYMATYAATKVFDLHFTEALATELRGTGVRAMALCPGPTDSEFGKIAHTEAEFGLVGHMAVDKCVRIGLHAFDRGRHLCVTGSLNQAGAIAVGLSPRAVVRRAIAPFLRPPRQNT